MVGIGIGTLSKRRYIGFPFALRSFWQRVRDDGGTMFDYNDVIKVYRFLATEGLIDDTELLYLSNGGAVQRVDGVLKYIRTGFDATVNENDLDGSATAIQQPRLVGGIAPNSKVAASNQNGEGRYFTHPAITFGAGDAWSVGFMLNTNLGSSGFQPVCVNSSNTVNTIYLNINSGKIAFRQTDLTIIDLVSVYPFIGKNKYYQFVADGVGGLKLYIDGVLLSTKTGVTTTFTIDSLFFSQQTNCSISAYHIQSGALTPTQVTAEYNLLRSMYPEIESVDIGTQTWATRNFEAVATPVGNVIANVTANGAVEKITNAADREFSSDTGFWEKGTNITIADGVCHFISVPDATVLNKTILVTTGKWYKITFTISNYSTGGVFVRYPFNNLTGVKSADGTYIIYGYSTLTSFGLRAVGTTTLDIDNISVQELNWSNATEIYDAVYAATSGDAATKEYAALKESAMWCYYNNSADNGAIYGKLYNWYAAKLLDLDMVTAGFGWRVPTFDQFTTLATYLGGGSVAGGKLKMTGVDYWTTPNTGADNSSGFTALPSGERLATTGAFSSINGYFIAGTTTTSTTNQRSFYTPFNGAALTPYLVDKGWGISIRLIKD